jgi:hypothetical protein
MAANIFNPSDYADIQQRLRQLTPDNQRQWGKMTLPEMLIHCSIQIKKALGILPATTAEGPRLYSTAVGRYLALYVFSWPKGAATPSDMNMTLHPPGAVDVDQTKNDLFQLLKQVQAKTDFNPHPFFGNMNKKDWGRLIWKHLDHHLRQFNG